MLLLAIDPGTTRSAYVEYDTETKTIARFGLIDNSAMIEFIILSKAARLAVEMIASYGMPVGKEVFETCLWIGRYIERFITTRKDCSYQLVYRKDVKIYLCGCTKAKDGNIRQAIIDRYGGAKDVAIGTKYKPGPLYGIKADIWAALGVVLTASDPSTVIKLNPLGGDKSVEN